MIELLWNAPVSPAKMSAIIATLELNPSQRVLDVGCGCGEVLIRLCEQLGISGTGIDLSEEYVAEAKRRAESRVDPGLLHFRVADAREFDVSPNSIDLIICMGATHAFGLGKDAFRNAIERATSVMTPGGLLLIADGYMKRPADPEYRKLLGDSLPDEMTHAANVETGQKQGLIPLAGWTSSDDEWDEFEWGYQRVIEKKAAATPQDENVVSKLKRRREWMTAYLRWGRDTLGYGIYLLQKPIENDSDG